MRNFLYFLTFVLIFNCLSLKANDVIDAVEEDQDEKDITISPNQHLPIVNETIKKISASKKIFIITNENTSFSKGDFISLLLNNQLVVRALVAKSNDSKMAGIKILKIYNTDLWNQLSNNKEVLVLKGDDSYFLDKDKKSTAKSKSKKKNSEENKIQSEDDLYNSSVVSTEDEQSFDENSKRLIKPDNLLGLNYGLIQSQDNSGSSIRYPHLVANWAYQFGDNIWGEASVGYNKIPDYPNVTGAGGIDTSIISITLKMKYAINAPYYSYIMPYIGFQTVTANSPGAGQKDPNATVQPTDVQLAKELQLVDELKRSGPVFGVSVLKRIVPGWFMRADLGSDIISGGLTLEF